MRTLIFIVVGLVLAGLLVGAVRPAWRIRMLLVFAVAWAVVVTWNLQTGMSHGYSLGEELPIQLLIFVVPVALARWLARARPPA
ncbi:hypothetical protein ASD77_17120 [Pseudoxanthomonas sp. Root65]|uniref:hypothetical protein n=1 Tax=Pseudoxanthomonas sp. Root65 TaxID=1736576 RepID=UPI0006FA6D74|nr:hypothetical protein [Pseudoxanthomonas sp. Root65]KRA51415.1 hypothetical protein ASD77_17120 [Pseudoxanthomonas sp. Root65]